MLLTVSEKAAQKIKQMAVKHGKTDCSLRIKVTGGGCSGLTYEFSFTDKLASHDKLIEQFGVKVAVDPQSLAYMDGSVLDYEQTIMKSGFKVRNPNATATCSCGESFSV